VLVLNATYEPLSVVPLHRAVHLLMNDKAEVIEDTEQPLRAAQFAMYAPSVIRLRYYIKIPHNLPMPLSRRAVLIRDSYTCQYCGATPGRENLTIDHVHPRSRGGRTEWDNVVAACGPCNRRKGSKSVEEARMPLLKQPIRPRFWAMALATTGGHESWKKYLR
jgi:5-methylcytosine-specific restriction endonuclease McrA